MLTPKQKKVLDFITSFIKTNDYSPSLEEVAKNFKLKSVSSAHQFVDALHKKGYLKKIENQQRSIELIIGLVEIPLFGYISAGEPIEAISNPEPIKVPHKMLSKSGLHYALKVKGDSMVD